MKHSNIGVIGAGVIGVGVAQALAQTGHRVLLVDINNDILRRGREEIARNLRFAAMFDHVLRDMNHAEILDRIAFTLKQDLLRDVDFVIENSTEDWVVKQTIYPQLDRVCRDDCIFAANTSTISITRIAATTKRQDRVLGLHFMNPVPQKRVVEVIRGWHTSESSLTSAEELLRQMGKRGIVVRDMPGFVSNRVFMPTINEAIFVLQDGVASPADVDEIFVECFAHKMGPLATADLIGLDTVLRSLEVLCDSYKDNKYRPCPLLKEMVAAGLLGRKTGRGFFEYV